LITITRLLARRLRAVFRRALGSAGTTGPSLSFTAGPEGLSVRAKAYDAAIQYHHPGELPAEQLTAPWELLAQCEGRKEEPVTLESDANGHVTAS
jgi:hypothetical protein